MQRILVIDDDPAVTSLLKRGLSYEGFAVETAQSGAEGFAVARERPSDLVILDVMMPGLGGFEVLHCTLISRTSARSVAYEIIDKIAFF